MIEFLHPWILIALLLIPFLFWLFKTKSSYLEGTMRISSSASLEKYFRKKGELKYKIIFYFKILTLVLIILAIARPRKIDQLQMMNIDVVDIILVIDISSSMLAEDFKPNRLEAVKDAAQEFIANRNGDRIGLLVFGKETFIQCPLTIDYSVLNSLLNEVTVMEPKYDGTAIGVAIASGVNRLRNSDSESKVIILLSDGSNNAGSIDPISAAKIAKEYGIKVYTIGAGTNQSITQIPGRGFVRNEIDEETLIGIADVTNAKYFRAIDKASLSGIYSEIDKLEKSEISVSYFSSFEEVYIWFILLGFVFIILSELLRTYYFRRVL